MRYLLTALAVSLIASSGFAADTLETRDLAYARCLTAAFEHGIKGGEAEEIYLVDEPEKGAQKGGAKFSEAVVLNPPGEPKDLWSDGLHLCISCGMSITGYGNGRFVVARLALWWGPRT